MEAFEIFVLSTFLILLPILIGNWNHNRGNSFWIGFLLSILLSPFVGFLIVALTKKNQRQIDQRAVRTGEMKRCSNCGELIRPEATRCRYCASPTEHRVEVPKKAWWARA
jgi:ribosomal protein L32